MNKEKIIKTLNEVKDEVRQKYKAEIKGVFGSFIRGQQKKDSDIDVLVEFKKGADLLDLVGLSLFLEDKLHTSIDVVPSDTIREEIKDTILKEAIYL